MDMFYSTCHGPQGIDLDDPETYKNCEWRDWSTHELYAHLWSELGRSLLYMQFMFPGHYKGQEPRVHQFCFWFVMEHTAHHDNTSENRLWYKKFLYRFLDEVENQC